MILLDTNVVSEAIKPEPYREVRAWLDARPGETLFISSITVAELLFGIGVLPEGKRRAMLASRIDRLLAQFDDRVLPFDTQSTLPASPSARAQSGGAFPRPTATSPRSPLPTDSPWPRAMRARSMRLA